MIPVLNAVQMRAVDEATIRDTPIASLDLMERAAARCTDRLLGLYAPERSFLILAGMGNNGGDGLAIARQLHQAGRRVRVVVVPHREQASGDHQANWQRALDAGVDVLQLAAGEDLPAPASPDVVIDALLGTGLARPLEGILAQCVRTVNSWKAEVVAIDLPTGLFASGNTGNDPRTIIRAARTLSFEVPKPAFLLPEHAGHLGNWEVLSIGLLREAVVAQASPLNLIEASDLVALIPARGRFAHKGTFGHALLLAGGPGKMGAVILAAEAAMASGAGRITAHVPAGSEAVMHAALPPVMISVDADPEGLSELPELNGYSAIGIGPGIGTADPTARLLKLVIQETGVPLVLDADAINLLSLNPTWAAFLPKGSILTPHPKEFDRLAGPSASGEERLQKARELAQRRGIILVLKGAFTAICTPNGKAYFNPTGNPGMAKGGSGDVLTGLITGLLAQGLPPGPAALLGVYVHGLAGDLAAAALGMSGMSATDLVRHVPQAWQHLAAMR